MTAQHTPTPWVARSSGPRSAYFSVIAESDRRQVCSVVPRLHGSSCSEWEANAEFIVRACNSHDALLAAAHHCEELMMNAENAKGGAFQEMWFRLSKYAKDELRGAIDAAKPPETVTLPP